MKTAQPCFHVGNLNTTAPGTIEVGGDIDMFRLVVQQSGRLSLRSTGSTDTKGTLYDGSRREIASDDDSGSSFNFAFDTELSPGTYYLKVEGFSDFDTGAYSVGTSFFPSNNGGGNNGGGSQSGGGGGGSTGPLVLVLLAMVGALTRRRKTH